MLLKTWSGGRITSECMSTRLHAWLRHSSTNVVSTLHAIPYDRMSASRYSTSMLTTSTTLTMLGLCSSVLQLPALELSSLTSQSILPPLRIPSPSSLNKPLNQPPLSLELPTTLYDPILLTQYSQTLLLIMKTLSVRKASMNRHRMMSHRSSPPLEHSLTSSKLMPKSILPAHRHWPCSLSTTG